MNNQETIPTSPLGTTGYQISTVGLGTWAIGGPWARGWGAQDDSDSISTIRYAAESGVNWLDTAAAYGRGHSEQVIGEALAVYPAEDRPYVFTKCGRYETPDGVVSHAHEASLRREVDASLVRLRTETIDVMQLHWPPTDVPLTDAWATLDQLRAEGKITHLGVCNVDAEQLRELEAIAHVDVFQAPLSLVNRSVLSESLPFCETNGIGMIAYSPMQSGLLTGKYDQRTIAELADDDWRKQSPDFTEPRLSKNLKIVEALRTLSDELGRSVSELAVAWTLHQQGVTAAIVGARRPNQVNGWIDSGSITLSPDQLALLEQAGN